MLIETYTSQDEIDVLTKNAWTFFFKFNFDSVQLIICQLY